MSSTFSNLKFELIGNGEQSGVWGTTTNANIGTAIEQAIVGMATLEAADFTANVATLTLSNTNAAQDARALCLNIDAGAVSAAGTVNVPAIQKPYLIINGSSYTVTVKVSGQTGVAVPAGTRTVVYNNGTDVGAQVTFLTSLALSTALPITSGGTGATTASGARTALSAQETLVSGTNIKTINSTSLLGSGNISTTPAVATPSAVGTVYGKQDTASAFQAYGYLALDGVTSGTFNTAVGQQSMQGLTTASQNTFVGHQTMLGGNGSSNTGIGHQVLYSSTSAPQNTAGGFQSMYTATTAGYNTAWGFNSLYSLTDGNSNVAIGYDAMFTGTTAANNTAIGRASMRAVTTGAGNIAVGGVTSGSVVSPVFAITNQNDRISMGTTAVTNAYVQVAWTVVSDARDKTDFAPVPHGLAFVLGLKPTAYRYKLDREATEGHGPLRYGFKAQEVLALEGDTPVIVDAEDDEKLRFNDQSLIPVLVQAIQELKAEFDAYKLSHP
jgi:hypothetical protein